MSDRCLSCESRLPPDGGIESAFTREDGHYCYDCVATPRIAFVACGSSKRDLDEGETVEARDLYDSPYFSLKREFAENCCDDWWILSAKHGLLSPTEEIETYDASLDPRSESYIGDYRAGQWSVRTANEIEVSTSVQAIHTHYVVLAGETYVEHIEETLQGLRHVEFPFRSDDLKGIGDQQGWLRDQIDGYHPPGQAGLEHWGEAHAP